MLNKVLNDRNEVTNILRKNYKRFECPESFFSEDSGLLRYNGEKLKILVLFMSNIRYKSSSNTFHALQNIIHSTSKNVFVDVCYFPHQDDVSLYDELQIPYLRGISSGFLVNDFDLIFVSMAVLQETVNLPTIYLHDNIPMGYNERREKKYPIIAMGGSTAHALSILCGDFELNGRKDRSLVDIVNFGKGGKSLPELINKCLEYDNVIDHQTEIINSLSNKWLIPDKLRFTYGKNNLINGELSGTKVLFDSGDTVTENFNEKVRNLDGTDTDRTDFLISYGCIGRGYCSFCLEGTTGGCWKEKDIKEIEKDILKSKIRNGSEACGVSSYNANYHSQIELISGLLSEYYDRRSVIMGRADVYAKSEKYITMCKEMGTIKFSIAAEGFSDRIRNQYLNKRLSRDDLHKAVRNLAGNEVITIKINYILTGKETEDDFKEWLEDITEMTDYMKDHQYHMRISLTITTLTIYDFTRLRYEERNTALESLNYENSEFIHMFMIYLKEIKKLGDIHITVHGIGYQTVFNQLLLDLGYSGTHLLVQSVIKDKLRYDKVITQKMSKDFTKRVCRAYNVYELLKERDADTWFPSDLVDYGEKHTQKGVLESYEDASCEFCISK